MKKVLVIIDMQNDFVDGVLATPEAKQAVLNTAEKIKSENWDKIYLTRDTHEDNYLQTKEGKKLPIPHCINGTSGHDIHPLIAEALGDDYLNNPKITIFDKYSFGCEGLALDILRFLYNHSYEDRRANICVCGLVTDICVITNVVMLNSFIEKDNDFEITVDAACCAGTSPEKHREALSVMQSLQINVINN